MMRIFSAMVSVGSRSQRGQRDSLRIDAVKHPWEGYHFADVLRSANPGDGAFQAQAEACMRNAAVPPQVEIPLELLLGQVVFADARENAFVARFALAAADDFAVTVRCNHVEAQSKLRAL